MREGVEKERERRMRGRKVWWSEDFGLLLLLETFHSSYPAKVGMRKGRKCKREKIKGGWGGEERERERERES